MHHYQNKNELLAKLNEYLYRLLELVEKRKLEKAKQEKLAQELEEDTDTYEQEREERRKKKKQSDMEM